MIRPSRRPAAPEALTTRQAEVCEWIRAHCLEHHAPPTLAEIAAGLGMSTRGGAKMHVDALRQKGHLAEGAIRPAEVVYITRP
jgi:SOS-response transcriptional repressor LexA